MLAWEIVSPSLFAFAYLKLSVCTRPKQGKREQKLNHFWSSSTCLESNINLHLKIFQKKKGNSINADHSGHRLLSWQKMQIQTLAIHRTFCLVGTTFLLSFLLHRCYLLSKLIRPQEIQHTLLLLASGNVMCEASPTIIWHTAFSCKKGKSHKNDELNKWHNRKMFYQHFILYLPFIISI